MTFIEANRISIKCYLAKLEIHPTKEMGYYGMYRCPFRKEDNDPSMKVDYNKNLWFDHGTGIGGTLIDLVMKMELCSEYDAITKLENGDFSSNYFSFQGNVISIPADINIKKIQSLQNRALLNYACIDRKINIDIARRYLHEVYYSVKDKSFFSLGFKNDAGGYELRNAYFKNCVTPKEITSFRNINELNASCLVFEGFLDYLSYLTLKKQIEPFKNDVIILNSTSLISHTIEQLSVYEQIYCFLDNDNAGRQAFSVIKEKYKHRVSDQSIHYREYNDLNDFLCDKKIKVVPDSVLTNNSALI
jgi:5S rRNA maturation endonuclease (ribonuclease M5)